MKRKLIAALMAMTLALSCGMVALADEPSEDGMETSLIGNDESEGAEKEAVVPSDLADISKDDAGVSGDVSTELEESASEKQNSATDTENAEEQELPIDEAHFPDANFREYIKAKIDTDENGSLSEGEIEVISSMNESDNTFQNIKNFKGIEYFPNLTYMNFKYMTVDSLDLSKNTKLIEVYINDCQITNLALNSNLEGLGCYGGSQISNLDVSNLKLKYLWCQGNLLPGFMSILTLEYLRIYDDLHLPYLDLSNHKNILKSVNGGMGFPGHHGALGGAFIVPQTLSRTVTSVNGVWTFDMASIVGKDYLDRVTLATEGAKMSQDGLVTFQSSEVPTELVYNFDMKTPAETTLMEVTVALSAVNDQTKEEVSVDTSGMDIDSICKDNNVNPNDVEIVVSQEAPSKEDADKLAGEATSKGYKVAATYEVLLKLFSQGNEIAEITENFGSVTLTLQAGKDYAGYKAAVFQLHNGQVIEHDGLTVSADGTVTITVDKFSTFAVAVSEETDPSINESTTNPGTSNPSTVSPTDNNNQKQSPKTGDEASVLLWLLCGISAFGMIAFLQRKKRLSQR